MTTKHLHSLVLLGSLLVALAGCGKSAPDTQSPAPPATVSDAAPGADAALMAKQQQIEQREAELALRERELAVAKREQEQARSTTAAPRPARRPAAPAAAPASSASTSAPATQVASKPVLVAVTVPSGTELTVALSSDLSTRTAKSGDPFEARLVSDLMVNGKRAVPANARVTGTVTDVISGHSRIGGVPTLGLRFDSLVLDDGQKVAINGELIEKGKSDTGRDTAKILGGAAAGAILGHQVKSNDSGKIVGGLLGGAIGAVAARQTGTEVQLAAGSRLTIALGAPFDVVPRP